LPSPGEESAPAIGRLLVLTDITEVTRMMQVRADFAANASHELRTPLSAIRGAVETLMQVDPAQDPAVVRQFLQMIDRHTERMQAMVADLLDLSRIETSPTQFKPAPLHVREVLDELRSRFAQAVEAKTLRWSEDLPANLETIHANAHLLRLVLDNLVDNAIKFTEPGGGITVAFQSSSSAGGDEPVVSISVSDTGCGIPEEEQDRVFERFYQVQRSRSGPQRGTGLGLSIVRHAVVAMHGAVTLRSKLGQGTTVTITLLQS
jgi:two-component system phosphate regulon sensor histidine kinase PhoR